MYVLGSVILMPWHLFSVGPHLFLKLFLFGFRVSRFGFGTTLVIDLSELTTLITFLALLARNSTITPQVSLFAEVTSLCCILG